MQSLSLFSHRSGRLLVLPRGRFAIRSRASSYYPQPPPPLFDLCVRRAYGEALERVRAHPHEARFKHPRNWTALHCCVEHVAPLKLVKAIYEANPQSLTTTDWQGLTPQDAAVDLETKEFLRQQTELHQTAKNDTGNSTTIEEATGAISEQGTSSTGTIYDKANDPMLLGKVLVHANSLSDKISELNETTRALQNEVDALKATLKGMGAK
ncbi:expressed unknown protein [Seminavis robusta]|uniref:Uncharacterized protein n=1 Tax=Seminavis robusta TaxID=568900 RepID=A0A9N8DBV8_9STRA|nr:expressed unknown protein [Seminavis robusta]|eukprot:Sro70_g038980.1 n/a (210) ;mRNA; f:77570-78199